MVSLCDSVECIQASEQIQMPVTAETSVLGLSGHMEWVLLACVPWRRVYLVKPSRTIKDALDLRLEMSVKFIDASPTPPHAPTHTPPPNSPLSPSLSPSRWINSLRHTHLMTGAWESEWKTTELLETSHSALSVIWMAVIVFEQNSRTYMSIHRVKWADSNCVLIMRHHYPQKVHTVRMNQGWLDSGPRDWYCWYWTTMPLRSCWVGSITDLHWYTLFTTVIFMMSASLMLLNMTWVWISMYMCLSWL